MSSYKFPLSLLDSDEPTRPLIKNQANSSANERNQQRVAGQGGYMITPYNFFVCDIMTWVLDTGSLFNICNTLKGLQVIENFGNNEKFLNVGDGRTVPVLALGNIQIVSNSHIIALGECHYCPSFLMNVISVGHLALNGYEICIKKDYCDIIMNGVTVINGRLNNGIYVLSQPVSVMYTTSKCPRSDDVSDIYLWHCRLGHINKNRINRLASLDILNINDCESLPTCESLVFLKR